MRRSKIGENKFFLGRPTYVKNAEKIEGSVRNKKSC